MFKTKKSFKQQRDDALSIFHKVKISLESINTGISNRRNAIAEQINALSTEDTEIQGIHTDNEGTLVDINSILRIDTVKEELNKK